MPTNHNMAATANQVKMQSIATHVQELATRATEPLERFMYNEKIETLDELPLLDILTVDATLLSSASMEGEEERRKLLLELGSSGYFQVVNHGIEDSLIDEVRKVNRQFFALPLEEKMKCARAVDVCEGYGSENFRSEKQEIDWSDRVLLTVFPEDQRKLNFWPSKPEMYRQVMEEYATKMLCLNEILLKAIAKSLDLEEDCFLKQFGERPKWVARSCYYPPCARPEHILGIHPHNDGSGLSFIAQDKEVEGLQVLKDDQWFRIPISPYKILVNVGDQLEIMSNGILKSPRHRAVTNSEKERNSIVLFCEPAPESEIGPAEALVDESRPRLYKTIKNYARLVFDNYYHVERPIELVKL